MEWRSWWGNDLAMDARPLERRRLDLSTVAVSAGRPRGPGAPLNEPLHLASIFRPDGERPEYGRVGNPSWTAFEDALGALEGGAATAFASGLAAAAAVVDGLRAGEAIVAPSDAYHGFRALLEEASRAVGLEVSLVDVSDTRATLAACEGARILWVETPTNPLMRIADLATLCRDAGIPVVVDNTFASPLSQRPLELGATAVVHSATKLLGGHSDLVLGAVVTRDAELAEQLRLRRTLRGAVPGAAEAFLALRGLRTLPLRVAHAQAAAAELAERLARHPRVTRVRYPGLADGPGHAIASRQMTGFGSLLSFELAGGAEAADRVCRATELIVHATSLGGVETLIDRRARWPGEHETPDSLLRLSVGCEHVDDLWADLERALDA
jgi:cystathionine gamma-synthase